MLLRGALLAEEKLGLKMNVPIEKVDAVIDMLPALNQPTLSALSDEGWLAVETVIDEKEVRDLLPQLKKVGAEGIIEYSLNKIIP
jgi:ATP phosphoribosyltransferase